MQWCRGLKQSWEAGSCDFPTDMCKVQTEEITSTQSLNFVPKFHENGGFQAPNFVFL